MGFIPVTIRGDKTTQLEGVAAVLRSMGDKYTPSIMPLLCAQLPSLRSYEDLVHVSAVPKMNKWVSGRSGGVIGTIKQVITADTYQASVEIAGDDWDDDRVGAYLPIFQEMVQSALQAPDELVTTNLIAQGESINSFDGVAFYGSSHVWPGGQFTTAQVNKQTGTGTTEAAIEADYYLALAAMMNWKDDRGRVKNPAMDFSGENKLVVHLPSTATMLQNFNRVFGVTKGGDAFETVVASGNATRKSALAGKAIVVADPYLTDANDWYIHSIGGGSVASKPFAFIDREPTHVTILGKGTEHFEKENTVLVMAKRRFGLGVLRPDRSQKIANA